MPIELMSSVEVLAVLDTKKRTVTFEDKQNNKITISLASLMQVTTNALGIALKQAEEAEHVEFYEIDERVYQREGSI